MFAIFDSKANAYGQQPTFAMNKDVLLREILQLFRDPAQAKNQLLTNAEDFSIFRIGAYDRKTGQISPKNHEHVANLHDLRALCEPQGAST